MASPQSHISFSLLIALLFSAGGIVFFGIPGEQAALAAIIIVIAGMLPNIDSRGDAPAKELGGLIAAVAPLLLLERFPQIRHGGAVRVALVVVCCYVLTRVLLGRVLSKHMVHRGMMHSIPAAIITAELTYIFFWELHWFTRAYLACASLIGFTSHLFIDAYGNLDLVGRMMGHGEKKPPVLKLAAPKMGTTFVMYAGVLVLGWIIAKDFYPSLKFYGGIKY